MQRPKVIAMIIAALLVIIGYATIAAFNHLPPFADDESVVQDSSKSETKSDSSPDNNDPKKQPDDTPAVELALYYVGVDDGGVSGEMIGCNDSLVKVQGEPVETDDKVVASMQALLANKDQNIGESGLYNALYQSDLTFVRWEKSGGEVTVYLTGTVASGGTCDDPRIINQLERTAATAADSETAKVIVNDLLIQDVLSTR
jgi:hypothetical protein